jgi:putative ABC transport system permease protein
MTNKEYKGNKMSTLMNDIKYSFRQLRKSPGFTAVAVLTLGLGIGATTSLFSVFNALVLDPFPYPESDRIVYVWSGPNWSLSALDYLDIKEQMTSFSDFGVYQPDRMNFGGEKSESIYGIRCTSGVLHTLGMHPMLGRLLNESDDQPSAEPVVVISHALWTRSFAANPQVIGKTMKLNGHETTIIGVMSADFEFSSPWYSGQEYELWTPFAFDIKERGRGNYWLLSIACLKPGVSVKAADAEIKTIGARLAKVYPETNTNKAMSVVSLRDQMTSNTLSRMRMFLGAVTLLLLVACANVASMLLARGTQRHDEFSVRLALGASRYTVARLLFAEALLLGLFGSVAGILFAIWGTTALRNLIPAQLFIQARRTAIRINGLVLLFSIGVALLSALLAGLLPALTAAKTSIIETMNAGGRSKTVSRIRHRFLHQLTVAQISVAVVLANCGILLFASYINVFKSNKILDTEQVLSVELTLQGDKYNENKSRLAFCDQLFERIGALPGVQKVAATSKMPLEGGSNGSFLVDEEVYDPAIKRQLIEQSRISPDYFAAVGLTMMKGRVPVPTDAKNNSVGVVINRAMAEHYWKGKEVIGKRIRPNAPNPPLYAEVIGVVEDVRQFGSEHPPMPEMYIPYAFGVPSKAFLIVRTSGDASALVPAIRNELAALDPDLAIANVRKMKDVLNASVSDRRLSASLINVFMVTTLILTMVGIYGTLSYNLLQRKQEIGVRIAVGALSHHILRFVFHQAGFCVITGLVMGLILTAGISFLMRSMVYNISPWNPLSLFFGLCTVGCAACLACIIPALRATRVDPMEALRYE